MSRAELRLLCEVPTIDDDPALFDPSPEWFVPGFKATALREDAEEDADGLGFRRLVERPEAFSKAWRSERPGRARRNKRLRAERSPKRSHAA